MSSSTATPMATGIERESAAVPARASMMRISSVAYAVEEMASEENTGKAIFLGSRWACSSAVATGRPMSSRLMAVATDDTAGYLESATDANEIDANTCRRMMSMLTRASFRSADEVS